MKTNLINKKTGSPDFGLFDKPLNTDLSSARLKTKMGRNIPEFLNFLFLRQFAFTGISTKDFTAGIAVADLGYAAKGFFYIHDIKNNILHEKDGLCFPFFKNIIAPENEDPFAQIKSKKLNIELKDSYIKAESEDISIELDLFKDDSKPLRICSKTSYNRWFFTKKQALVKAQGKLKINGKEIDLEKEKTFCITDRSLGFPGREIWWNWASASTELDFGDKFGMNLSWGINQTGETENIIWFNNETIKINQASFNKNEDDTWSVKSNDSIIDLKFYPEKTKTEKENFIFTATKFTQHTGIFEGTLNIDKTPLKVNFRGWFEDHYIKW
ncbi:MAG: DUF2804 domain-containing protein [Thermodesulfobacteriota bacterium]